MIEDMPVLGLFLLFNSNLDFNLCNCRPILVLPPADVKIIYCELSEAEKDFYEALFKKSKVCVPIVSFMEDKFPFILCMFCRKSIIWKMFL